MIRYAFQVPNTRSPRVLPIVNGETARTPVPLAKATADGFTVLAWPQDPAGYVEAADLANHLPDEPDPAVAALQVRREAIASAPEAEGVESDVLDTLAAADLPVADARALMRGLSRDSIYQQFAVKPEEPMAQPSDNEPKPANAREKRLKEIKGNMAPPKEQRKAAVFAAADTDAKRERLLAIKIEGLRGRVETGRGSAADRAKLQEVKRAEIMSRAESIPLAHALAVAGFTFD